MAETKVGWIYCAICGAFPGMIKVGTTSGDPNERMRQLSAASGVPTPFVLAYSRQVRDPFTVESTLHTRLAPHRVNDSREFFSLPLHEAIKLIDTFDEVSARSAVHLETPFADLFSTFTDETGGRELDAAERAAVQTLRDELAWETLCRETRYG